MHASGSIGFGIVTYRPRGRFGPRRQEPYQLVVIHKGSLKLSVNNAAPFTLRPKEGVLLGPGDVHNFEFSDTVETTHSWCQIPVELVPRELALPSRFLNRPGPCTSWLMDFLLAGWQLNTRSQPMLTAAVMSALWDFCGAFASKEPAPLPAPLERAHAMIASRLATAISLDEIVRHAGVSKGHFIKLANDHWGAPPMEYLWRWRVHEAAHLLRATGLSVSEVAYRTGFANPFHFSRKFRRSYGMSPRAWRQAEWKGIKP